jgi:hypothetical protein
MPAVSCSNRVRQLATAMAWHGSSILYEYRHYGLKYTELGTAGPAGQIANQL